MRHADRSQRWAIIGLALILISVVSVSAFAGTVKLTIKPDSTSCADGAPLADCPVTGWEIQRAAEEWEVFTVLKGLGATTLTTTITAPEGKHCYRVRANSAKGWSALSNILCVQVPGSVPGAPIIFVEITVKVPVP